MADPAARPAGLINSVMGWFKSAPPPVRDLGIKQEVKYPDLEEADLGREVDQFYGNPKQAWFQPGVDIRTIDIRKAPEVLNDYRFDSVKWEKLSQYQADNLYIAAVAANKSALAGLGFDPRAVITSPLAPVQLNIRGQYNPATDTMWTDEKSPPTYVHESVHRGVEELRRAGLIARSPEEERRTGKQYIGPHDDEMITRAVMQRHFGDVERKTPYANIGQIDSAKKAYLDDERGIAKLDALEALAAKLIQQRTPRGPR